MFCPGGITGTVLYNTKYAKKENYLETEIYKMYRFFGGFFVCLLVAVFAGHVKCSFYN